MSERPAFIPVYEERETAISERMVSNLSDDWRKEKGDFMHDAIDANPIEIKQLEANQDDILKNSFALYAEGEYLDLRVGEVGVTRDLATANKRTLNIQADAGVVVPLGYTLLAVVLDSEGNTLEYVTDAATTYATATMKAIAVTCRTAGVVGNIATGSEFILSPAIPGIQLITDIGTVDAGEDTETDTALWAKYQDRITKPDTGGNKNDYVRWIKALKDANGNLIIGSARCIPRWNGNGTVKVVIVNSDMTPANAALVLVAQNYLDPLSAGLGEGKAPCGSAVTVTSAAEIAINVATTSISWDPTADIVGSTAAFKTAVGSYLRSLVFTGQQVILAKIAGLLITTAGVSNYTGLKLNGAILDISISIEQVATMGTVTL
jgi:uncharacterized phage protein gp47/JayE